MSEPVAPVEIANLALDLIKTENVEDIVDVSGDPIASVLNRWWDVSRRKCLEGFPWVFASTRDSIPLVSPAPAFGYTDAYQLPSNFASLNFIDDESLPLNEHDYVIEGDHLLANNGGEESLNIGYVKNDVDIAKWTSAFKIYVAYQLAYFTVFALTGQNQTTTRIQNQLTKHQTEAKAINGLMSPPRAYRDPQMLRARRTYRS